MSVLRTRTWTSARTLAENGMNSDAHVRDEPDTSNDTPVAAGRADGFSAPVLAFLTVEELDEIARVAPGRAVPADAAGIDSVHALMPVLVLDHHPRRHGVVHH